MTRDQRPAIIGIGCRLPGGTRGPAALWDAILDGRDVLGPIPGPRWQEMTAELHPDQQPATPWVAGLLDDGDQFDAGFFGVGPAEAAAMDPQQRVLLEVVVEALADAGIPPSTLAGRRVGVYVGAAAFDQATYAFTPGRRTSMHTASGAAMSLLANRISYTLDLRGESVTVDTACSSSLLALHLACRALRTQHAEVAVVAGVNLLVNPTITASFVDGGVLSPSGQCRPFDANADGYLRAEGVGAVILKPAGLAHAEHDRVYAVVAGGSTNSDGRVPGGLYAPSRVSQQQLLTQALADADLEPGQVGYLHAHGTGTKAGDMAETHALARVYGHSARRPLAVGSAKGQLGHTEGAAGIVGAILTALAVYHGTIPPTHHLKKLRPAIARLGLRFPIEPEPWPEHDGPRVAGVSAFGFGGTNTHTLLSGWPQPAPPVDTAAPVPIVVSGHTPDVLAATADSYADVLERGPGRRQIAATTAYRRDHHAHRAAVIATRASRAADALAALAAGRPHPALVGPRHAPGKPPQVVFVFSGHGAQHDGMGAELYSSLPVFRAAVDDALTAMARHTGHLTWHPTEPTPPQGTAEVQQALFAMQVGMAAVLTAWGLRPAAVVGHSLGEVAAAHVAGALSLPDAARLVCLRSELLADAAAEGGLLATALSAETALSLIDETPGVTLACDNGPTSTVLAGSAAALAKAQAQLDEQGVWARPVPDSPPAHSPLLEPYLDRLAAGLRPLHPRAAHTLFISTRSAGPRAGVDLGPDYWTSQLRYPVLLRETIARTAREQATLFIEIAPRSVLASALAETLDQCPPGSAVASSPRLDEPMLGEHARLLHVLAVTYTHGHDPGWPVPSGLPPAPLPPPHWSHTAATPTRPCTRDQVADLAARLDAATDEERRELVEELLRVILAQATHQAEIDTAATMPELGISSIGILEPLGRLRQAHPMLWDVSVAELLTHRVRDLASVLADRLTARRPA